MTIHLTIERFEGPRKQIAVLLTEDGNQIDFPKKLLPRGVKPGDILSFNIEKDAEATRQVAEESRKLQDEFSCYHLAHACGRLRHKVDQVAHWPFGSDNRPRIHAIIVSTIMLCGHAMASGGKDVMFPHSRLDAYLPVFAYERTGPGDLALTLIGVFELIGSLLAVLGTLLSGWQGLRAFLDIYVEIAHLSYSVQSPMRLQLGFPEQSESRYCLKKRTGVSSHGVGSETPVVFSDEGAITWLMTRWSDPTNLLHILLQANCYKTDLL